MTLLADLLRAARRVDGHRPWPRAWVSPTVWQDAGRALARGQGALLGLWGDAGAVHLALLDDGAAGIAVLSLDCPQGAFPSLGCLHPPALRLERAIQDLWGFTAQGLPDPRPWLDHGRWELRHPLGVPAPASAAPPPSGSRGSSPTGS